MLTCEFRAMGVTNWIALDMSPEDPGGDDVLALGTRSIVEVDRTCSRFLANSELSRLNRAAGQGPVAIGDLLWDAIDASLMAAQATDGIVDPTVGSCLLGLRYTVTFSALHASAVALRPPAIQPAAGWTTIDRDWQHHTVGLARESSLDLGATGKAWAADRTAEHLWQQTGRGALVNCGGDIACAGPAPAGGWHIRVGDERTTCWEDVRLRNGGIATSSPGSRSWRCGDETLHHIVDPKTGTPVAASWTLVSAAARSCAAANAAATAAVVLGDDAADWLEARHIPARLVHCDGRLVRTGGWPQ